ncbi:MAG TPA: sugar ABC transporter ATP-binding protein [Firmicutes bacterium]|nr:sugar ABC transporter ATP-binding protein [Bacillota bacterium]
MICKGKGLNMIKKFKSFIPYVKGSYFLAFISLFCALLATSSKLFIPFLAGKCVNLMKDTPLHELDLSGYFLIMAIFLVVGTLFRYVFDYITYLVGQRVIKNIRNELFEATLESPISSIDQARKGDLLLRLVNDVENVQTGLVSGFAAFYDGIISILITLVFMFTLNWILGLVVVGLTPISIFVSRFVSKFNSKHFRKQRSAQGMVNAFASESLTNSEAVATLNIAKDRIDQFDELSDEFRKSTFKANLGASTINPSTRLVNALINGALVLIGAILIIENPRNLGLSAFAVGDLSAFLTYASSYMQPFNEISNVVSEIDYALASFQRIDETIHGKKDINQGKEVLAGSINDLQAKDITFSYDGKRDIIKDFSLDIYKGHKIAFVGPTGCGKTTLINLLMRFYDPQRGAFYANHLSTQDLEKSAFRSHIGMVLQDTWIFNGTVFENIAYAKEGATKEEVEEAARKAQAAHFIERLPQGYDTQISDSSGLSVGEKQLICVARVMLLEPEIVILDEATSNIDVRTEKLLSEAFDKLMEGKTSLVVAHRLSTIVSSDLIVVLKDGKIIETGNHRELIAKKGFYYSLYNAQFN